MKILIKSLWQGFLHMHVVLASIVVALFIFAVYFLTLTAWHDATMTFLVGMMGLVASSYDKTVEEMGEMLSEANDLIKKQGFTIRAQRMFIDELLESETRSKQ